MFKGSIFTFNMYCFEKYLHGFGNMCMNKICCENGFFFVNDLISENKMLFTYHVRNLGITIILD
jgi:hypothetical protein